MPDILYPDIAGGFAKGLQARSQFEDARARREEREREEKIRQAMESVSGDNDPLNNDLFSTLPIDKQNMIRKGIALDANLDANQQKTRYNAMFKDFRLAENLLDSGLEQEAVSLLQDRAQNTDYGQDTAEILQAYQSGGAPVLKKYLGAFNNLADSKRTKETSTAQEKNFAKLEQLKQQGDQQAVDDFSKMIGLTENKKLSSALEKQILKAQDDYFTNDQQARQMKVLANDISRMDIGGGVASTTTEKFKSILGSQDDVTELRRRFNAIRTSQAVVNLPPGVASDKDIELALKGFPAENANAMQIVSFLNGQEKLSRINADFNRFKAEWFSDKKQPSGLLKAWQMQAAEKFKDGGEDDKPKVGSGRFKIEVVN